MHWAILRDCYCVYVGDTYWACDKTILVQWCEEEMGKTQYANVDGHVHVVMRNANAFVHDHNHNHGHKNDNYQGQRQGQGQGQGQDQDHKNDEDRGQDQDHNQDQDQDQDHDHDHAILRDPTKIHWPHKEGVLWESIGGVWGDGKGCT